jgi:hypothetical protein
VFTDRNDPIIGAGGSCSEISDLMLSARRSHAVEDQFEDAAGRL